MLFKRSLIIWFGLNLADGNIAIYSQVIFLSFLSVYLAYALLSLKKERMKETFIHHLK